MTDPSLTDLLGERAATLLADSRVALDALVVLAEMLEHDGKAAVAARLVREHLDEFFLLVVVGEVKSGKSSLINALLGTKVQEEGPLPLTDRIYVLRHGDQRGETVRAEFVVERVFPNEMLRLFQLVDTPGTNSIVRQHQSITESFIPKADLTLFVTSIDRPFSESEHQFLNLLNDKWRRRVIFVLTKIDAREPEELQPVVDYIKDNCRRFYDFEPRVFALSARQATKAVAANDAAALAASGLPALKDYLLSSLAERERVKLKLSSPVESGLALLGDLDATMRDRREHLDRDFQALNDLDAQVAQKAVELRQRVDSHVVRIYDLLREFERRGHVFFEEQLKLSNFGLLRDDAKFRALFETKVVADLKDRIGDTIHDATDFLMKEQIALFERALRFVTEHLVTGKYKGRVVAPDPTQNTFDYNRERLVADIRDAFAHEIARFDVEGECKRVAEAAYRGILQQVGVHVGAVGLGALLVALLSGILLDVTGVLAAGVLFTTGFVILPKKKRALMHRFSLRVDELVREFRAQLSRTFERELSAMADRIKKAYEPYLVFYRAEIERLTKAQEQGREIRLRLLQIVDSVKALDR